MPQYSQMKNRMLTKNLIKVCWLEFTDALKLFAPESAFRVQARERYHESLKPLIARIETLERELEICQAKPPS